jgi:acyl carrier protein
MMKEAIEKKLRVFLADDLMKEQAEFFTMEDELDLDSLDQTELRVFLTEEFGINTEFDNVPAESLGTLGKIGSLIEPQAA